MRNKSLFLTFFSLMLVFTISASAQTWEIDKAHSGVGFTVKHMVVAKSTANSTISAGQSHSMKRI